jgi:hypothetical protein
MILLIHDTGTSGEDGYLPEHTHILYVLIQVHNGMEQDAYIGL